MKAWVIDGFDGIETLRQAELDSPDAEAGRVVLRVRYAALNPADYYLAAGQYPAEPTFPHVLGRDGIGVVESVGEGVSGMSNGDVRLILRGDVGVERSGTLTELVSIEAERLVTPPEDWTPEQAAAAPLVYLTAWQALTQFPDLPDAATVLVTGASGGVGVASIHLARALGHRVVALSRGDAKRQMLRDLGADHVVNTNSPDVAKDVRTALGGGRVDLAIDNVGGAMFNDMIATLAENGRISCVGRLAGPVPEFNTASLFFRRLQIRGVGVYAFTADSARQAWEEIVRTLARAGARPVVDQVFDFEDVPAAFARLREGPAGKVLVRVSA